MRQVIFCIVLSMLIPGFTNAQEYDPRCDINEDGIIDSNDLLLLQYSWHGVASTPTPTPSHTPTWTPPATPTPLEEVTVDLPNLPAGAKPLVLLLIPAGSFQMGSGEHSDWWSCWYACEQPVHTVNIDYDFSLGRHEVTVGQYTAFLRSTEDESGVDWAGPGCPLTRTGGDYSLSGNDFGQSWDQPMVEVSWYGADAFAAWVSSLPTSGGTVRLPSEAEWEYACRAGTTTRFSFGDSTCGPVSNAPCDLSLYAWWYVNDSPHGTKIVGQKLPNPFGLYDMHGNVDEWCQDWWHDDYTGAPNDGSAWEAGGGSERVRRGGHWYSLAKFHQSAARSGGGKLPTDTGSTLGFRVARSEMHQPTPSATRTASATPTRAPTPADTPTVTGTPLEEVTIDIPDLPADATPLVLVRIPAGSFQMGSDDPPWSWIEELPVHTVNIGYDFYLGKYEITQAQYEAVMEFNPAYGYGVGNNFPAYRVCWNDWHVFLTALNALVPGGGFRMPSEAEWEYACRAGTTTRFSFGDSTCDPIIQCGTCELNSYGWWCANNDPDETKTVGQKLPNPFGLYDIHGNVHEFCQDRWHSDYTGAPADGSAWETGDETLRVMRGGRHDWPANDARSSYRDYDPQGYVFTRAGFRIARDVQQPPPAPPYQGGERMVLPLVNLPVDD